MEGLSGLCRKNAQINKAESHGLRADIKVAGQLGNKPISEKISSRFVHPSDKFFDMIDYECMWH